MNKLTVFKEHFVDGVYHRVNGPSAYDFDDTTDYWGWHLFGSAHRYYGPADENGDWWIHGEFIK
jgi:hypothetical protein